MILFQGYYIISLQKKKMFCNIVDFNDIHKRKFKDIINPNIRVVLSGTVSDGVLHRITDHNILFDRRPQSIIVYIKQNSL